MSRVNRQVEEAYFPPAPLDIGRLQKLEAAPSSDEESISHTIFVEYNDQSLAISAEPEVGGQFGTLTRPDDEVTISPPQELPDERGGQKEEGYVPNAKDIDGIVVDILKAAPDLEATLLETNVRAALKATKAGITLPVQTLPAAEIQQLPAPVPDLDPAEITAIKAFAKANPWPGKRGTAAAWVETKYAKWIPGLLREHLLDDNPLYQAFSRLARDGKLPPNLDVPTADENALRRLPADELPKVMAAREINSKRLKNWRANKM